MIDKNDPRYLQAALRALCSFSGAANRWRALAERGATDEELLAAISYELGIEGGSTGGSGSYNVAYKGGLHPCIWITDRVFVTHNKKPDFEGRNLIRLVRELFQIPELAGQLMLL